MTGEREFHARGEADQSAQDLLTHPSRQPNRPVLEPAMPTPQGGSNVRYLYLTSLLLLGACVQTPGNSASYIEDKGCVTLADADAISLTSRFLDSYVGNDEQAVRAFLAPDVKAYGTDVSEFFSGPDGVVEMLRNDQKLWRRSGSLGDVAHSSVVGGCGLASVAFHRPFLIPGRPAVHVRFNMIIRDDGERWLLAQSANSVPTVGQSAEELLKAN